MVPGKHGHGGQCLFVVFPSDLLHDCPPPKRSTDRFRLSSRCQEIPRHGSMYYLEGEVEGRKTSSLMVSHCHHGFPFLFDEFDFMLPNKKPVRLIVNLGLP